MVQGRSGTSGKDQIQGWKEIASFLGRDERTAKRWEKQRGLPVRRIPGGGRANVYVLVSELDAWLAEGAQNVAQSAAEPPATVEPEAFSEVAPAEVVAGEVPEASPVQVRPRRLRGLWFAAAVVSALLMLVLVRTAVGGHSKPTASDLAASTAGRSPASYRSHVSGVDELYLRGVYFYEERTPASLERARQIFSEVIQRDDHDAPAFAGLAETYLLQREYATRSTTEAYAQARVAAERALALDPRLAEADAVLGFVDFFGGFDAKSATEHFKTAIRIDPNCVLAHHWYGSMLTHQGRYAEALDQLNIAERLNPRSAAVISSRAFALGLSGQRPEALTMLNQMIQTDPGDPSPPRITARLYLQPPQDLHRYFTELQRFEKVRNDAGEERTIRMEQEAFETGGERKLWLTVLAREKETHPLADDPSYVMAEAEAQLGHKEEALAMLTVLAQKRDYQMVGLRINPLLLTLRDDIRFQAILVKLNLNGEAPIPSR